MKLKFRKTNEQGHFLKSKRGKSTKFLGKFISLPNKNSWNVMEQVGKRNDVLMKRLTSLMESFLKEYLKAKPRLYKKHKTCFIPVKNGRKHRIKVCSFAYVIYNKSRFEEKTTKI